MRKGERKRERERERERKRKKERKKKKKKKKKRNRENGPTIYDEQSTIQQRDIICEKKVGGWVGVGGCGCGCGGGREKGKAKLEKTRSRMETTRQGGGSAHLRTSKMMFQARERVLRHCVRGRKKMKVEQKKRTKRAAAAHVIGDGLLYTPHTFVHTYTHTHIHTHTHTYTHARMHTSMHKHTHTHNLKKYIFIASETMMMWCASGRRIHVRKWSQY